MLALLCLAMSGTEGCKRVRVVSEGEPQYPYGDGRLYTPYAVVAEGGRELVLWSPGGHLKDRTIVGSQDGLIGRIGYSCVVRTKRDSEGRGVLVRSPRRCRKVQQK